MKKFFIGALLLTVLLGVAPTTSFASENQVEVKIEYKSNIIGWRFKSIDGHAYKRQYDYTADKWLGEWVRV